MTWLVLFYMVPVGFVSSLANLKTLTRLFPFVRPIISHSPAISAVLQGHMRRRMHTLYHTRPRYPPSCKALKFSKVFSFM